MQALTYTASWLQQYVTDAISACSHCYDLSVYMQWKAQILTMEKHPVGTTIHSMGNNEHFVATKLIGDNMVLLENSLMWPDIWLKIGTYCACAIFIYMLLTGSKNVVQLHFPSKSTHVLFMVQTQTCTHVRTNAWMNEQQHVFQTKLPVLNI